MKILFFIESLRSGGKERRLVELLSYLAKKPGYECHVVLMFKNVDYPKFLDLKIPYTVIERKYFKKDPALFFKFYKVCRKFGPDLIHTWGSMVSFYAIPTKLLQRLPMVNSQVTDAPRRVNPLSFDSFINRFSFFFSDYILSNSRAGLRAYNIRTKNSGVIRNGIDQTRISGLIPKQDIKHKYAITTEFAVIMVANYSSFKKNQLFVDVANNVVSQRNDVTFISIGDGDPELFEKVKSTIEDKQRVLMPGKTNNIESLINACDIGVLFTNGEGVSNAILEYMLLGKPVIAHRYGGTEEFVIHNETGLLLDNDDVAPIASQIIALLNDREKREVMGSKAAKLIETGFSLEKMGSAFENIYKAVKA
ncbi:MAG: glycosyltransferase family 4 protein [Bacteroidota bacterium]